MTVKRLLQLQKENGANPRLIAHHKVVANVAEQIAAKFSNLGLKIDKTQVTTMAAIHDIGKIKVTQELFESGKQHERVGFELAKELGISEELAQICTLHSSEDYPSFSLEVLTVILADNLWKGKRLEALEMHIAKDISEQMQSDYWLVLLDLDSAFESIAEKGHERLIAMP